MRATVALDDALLRKAQQLSGVSERTALLREALKALIHLEASRRLAAIGGSEPGLPRGPGGRCRTSGTRLRLNLRGFGRRGGGPDAWVASDHKMHGWV